MRLPNLTNSLDRVKIAIKSFWKGFGLLLCYEIIEELLENLIALGITTIIAKAISFLLVVILTQAIKVSAKSIVILLKPFIKTLTYRKGDDKMKFFKNIFLNLKANWKNYLGVISVGLAVVTPFFQDLMDFGIGIQVYGYNIVPFAIIAFSALSAIIGVCVDGFHFPKLMAVIRETKKQFKNEKKVQDEEAKNQKQFAKENEKLIEKPAKVDNNSISAYVGNLFKEEKKEEVKND